MVFTLQKNYLNHYLITNYFANSKFPYQNLADILTTESNLVSMLTVEVVVLLLTTKSHTNRSHVSNIFSKGPLVCLNLYILDFS